jgi:hypothetical protein
MSVSSMAATIALATSIGLQISTEEGPAAALARAEARWHAQRPKSYTFTIVRTCECFPKGMSFRVIEGQPQPTGGADAASAHFRDHYGTVEKLFALIRHALSAGGHRIEVKYDAALGYPIWADLDPRKGVNDDELFFRVTGFRRLDASARWGLPNTPRRTQKGP